MGAQHDVIILGGGISGLVTGAICARAGLRVLLVEKSDQLGGRTRYTRVGGFHIPPGPRAFPRESLDTAFERAGIEAPVFQSGKYRFFDSVTGEERPFLQDHEERAERKARYHLTDTDLDELEGAIGNMDPDTWQAKSMAQWMEGQGFSARLRRLMSASLLWATDMALTPETVSMDRFSMGPFALFIGVVNWIENVSDPRVTDAFAAAITRQGGEIRLSTEAERIVVTGGAARGVVLRDLHGGDASFETAPRVVSCIPFPQLVAGGVLSSDLLPPEWTKAAAPSDRCGGGYVTNWYALREPVIEGKNSTYVFAEDPETAALTVNTTIIGPFSNRIPDVAPPGKQLVFAIAKIAPHEREDWPALLRKIDETHARTATYFKARRYPELDRVTEFRAIRIHHATWGQQNWSIYADKLPTMSPPGIENLHLVGGSTRADPGTFGFNSAVISGLHCAAALTGGSS